MKKANKKSRRAFPIAIKLVLMSVTIMSALVFTLTQIASDFFAKISRDREEASNRDLAKAKANEIERMLTNYISRAEVIARLMLNPTQNAASIDLAFKPDKDFVAISILAMNEARTPITLGTIVNESYLKGFKQNQKYIITLRSLKPLPISSAFSGAIEIRNSSMGAQSPPLITIIFPFVKDEFGAITHVAVADIRLDRIQEAFTTITERTLYLITNDGKILAHPSDHLPVAAQGAHYLPIVQRALKSEIKQEQVPPYRDPIDGQTYVGAYSKIPLGVTVISQVKEAVITEPTREVKRKVIHASGLAFSLSIFLVFVFSFSLSSPIEKLSDFTRRVAQGNFDLRASQNVRSRDEVGELARAFDEMTAGLKERDKIKTMFNKFHGSSITENLLRESRVNLGGTNRLVTVFFSDIRDFTHISEKHTPEQVVKMLNEYFETMVEIINRHGGIVDKFIGDAIMAVWGAPKSSPTDAQAAAAACLEMRQALNLLNERRIARNEHPLKIGMALHTGHAISGTIGSEERMEYTVIGDTVNQSSRIEAATKVFGTDLLISEATAEAVKDQFLLEKAGTAGVKGKQKPLTLYKVNGLIRNGVPVEIKTPYSSFTPQDDEKVKAS